VDLAEFGSRTFWSFRKQAHLDSDSILLQLYNMAKELEDDGCYIALTDDLLDAKSMMDRVRSPKAGAIVLFAGTTTLFYRA